MLCKGPLAASGHVLMLIGSALMIFTAAGVLRVLVVRVPWEPDTICGNRFVHLVYQWWSRVNSCVCTDKSNFSFEIVEIVIVASMTLEEKSILEGSLMRTDRIQEHGLGELLSISQGLRSVFLFA